MVKSSPIIAVMLFIFLLAALFVIGSLPSYFSETQRTILYLVSFLGFGVALAFSMK